MSKTKRAYKYRFYPTNEQKRILGKRSDAAALSTTGDSVPARLPTSNTGKSSPIMSSRLCFPT